MWGHEKVFDYFGHCSSERCSGFVCDECDDGRKKLAVQDDRDGGNARGRCIGKRGMILKADHFEELFGEGVKLKSITLEITDEPVTWGVVDEWLPWLKTIKGGYLHGGFTAKSAPLELHGGNFQRDLSKK